MTKERKPMQQMDFTIKNVEALKPPTEGRLELKDTKAPGLYLRVTPSGVKSFSFVGRPKGSSRTERTTLGKYPAVKPEEARRLAYLNAGKHAAGASLLVSDDMTVGELAEKYLGELKHSAKRPEVFETLYKLYIGPQFHHRRLSEVRAIDVEKWHRGLPAQILKRREEQQRARDERDAQYLRDKEERAKLRGRNNGPAPQPKRKHLSEGRVTGKTIANRALGSFRAMFNYAKQPKYGYFIGENPAAGHKPFKEVERERFLTAKELGPFFTALAQEENLEARDSYIIKLLAGARRSNVQSMCWSEVDLDEAVWRIPDTKTKNGTPASIPLVDVALEILKARKENATSEFVFSSDKSETGHIVNTGKAWRRILERSGIKDLREHDLRRSLGSWQARNGASLVLIGKSLHHMDPSSTQIYARLDMDPVRASMSEAADSMLVAGGLKQPANVIQFPKAKAQKASKQPKTAKGARRS
ncbi:MAG: site-specific integrase [Chrysiogenetes bacterium]|nr:site-specific integrase [Chrysiogenetes bacterium]